MFLPGKRKVNPNVKFQNLLIPRITKKPGYVWGRGVKKCYKSSEVPFIPIVPTSWACHFELKSWSWSELFNDLINIQILSLLNSSKGLMIGPSNPQLLIPLCVYGISSNQRQRNLDYRKRVLKGYVMAAARICSISTRLKPPPTLSTNLEVVIEWSFMIFYWVAAWHLILQIRYKD